jgi:hypothetical protein
MNRLIFYFLINFNYNDYNDVKFILIIIISPHLVNKTDKLLDFYGKIDQKHDSMEH